MKMDDSIITPGDKELLLARLSDLDAKILTYTSKIQEIEQDLALTKQLRENYLSFIASMISGSQEPG